MNEVVHELRRLRCENKELRRRLEFLRDWMRLTDWHHLEMDIKEVEEWFTNKGKVKLIKKLEDYCDD